MGAGTVNAIDSTAPSGSVTDEELPAPGHHFHAANADTATTSNAAAATAIHLVETRRRAVSGLRWAVCRPDAPVRTGAFVARRAAAASSPADWYRFSGFFAMPL